MVKSLSEKIMQNESRIDAKLVLAHQITDWLEDNGLFRTCVNCERFKDELCTKYNARPPAKVIVVGCDSHTDLIPF